MKQIMIIPTVNRYEKIKTISVRHLGMILEHLGLSLF